MATTTDTIQFVSLKAARGSVSFKLIEWNPYPAPLRPGIKTGAIGLPGQPQITGTQLQVIVLAVAGNFQFDAIVGGRIIVLPTGEIQRHLQKTPIVRCADQAAQSQATVSQVMIRKQFAG